MFYYDSKSSMELPLPSLKKTKDLKLKYSTKMRQRQFDVVFLEKKKWQYVPRALETGMSNRDVVSLTLH